MKSSNVEIICSLLGVLLEILIPNPLKHSNKNNNSIFVSTLKILTFLIFLPVLVWGQNEELQIRKDTVVGEIIVKDDKIASNKCGDYVKLYRDEHFYGSLKNYLAHLLRIDTSYIFSNKPSMISDSIIVDFTLPGALRYSNKVRILMIESYQHAYLFELKDTILPDYETFYNVEVVDPNRLAKATIFDSGDFTTGIIKNIPNHWVFQLGFPLESITTGLNLVRTLERSDKGKLRIPIRTTISCDYGGLYVYSVPFQRYDLDNKSLGFLKFNTLLDVNPMLLEYGMQVKKITRPIIGKVVHFVDKEEFKKKYRRSFPPFRELPR